MQKLNNADRESCKDAHNDSYDSITEQIFQFIVLDNFLKSVT